MTTVDNNKDFGEIEVQVLKHVKVSVSDLKAAIDAMAESSETVKDHILEIARQVDERQLCKQDEISRVIKRLLKDKIAEGKITEKWIEDCLPKEYKRKYEKRSASLSEMVESRQADGTVVLQITSRDSDGDRETGTKATSDDTGSRVEVSPEHDYYEFEIPKDSYQAVLNAMNESKDKTYLKFKKNGTILQIESDVKRKEQDSIASEGSK